MNDVLYRISQSGPNDPEYGFHCPGCGFDHWFKTTGNKPRWTFNNDMVKPSVTPSIVVFQDDPRRRCHLFVYNGMLQFLNDCFHTLRGQTVPMEPV